MAGETDLQQTVERLAIEVDTHNAEIIGLAAIIANLPGVIDVPRNALDATIEGECQHRGRQARDKACAFAHGILEAAREKSGPGISASQDVHLRGYRRGR